MCFAYKNCLQTQNSPKRHYKNKSNEQLEHNSNSQLQTKNFKTLGKIISIFQLLNVKFFKHY